LRLLACQLLEEERLMLIWCELHKQ
jgi:hypothetical protein